MQSPTTAQQLCASGQGPALVRFSRAWLGVRGGRPIPSRFGAGTLGQDQVTWGIRPNESGAQPCATTSIGLCISPGHGEWSDDKWIVIRYNEPVGGY